MHPIDTILVASFIYVPILALLYLADVWVILKPGSPFKGPFYTFFVATAVVDLTMIGVTYHEFRLEMYPLTNAMFENYTCEACLRARVTTSYICPMAQNLMNCFVALNRLTSVRTPMRQGKMWNWLLPLSILGSYLLPMAIFIPPGFRKMHHYKIEQVFDYTSYLVYIDDQSFAPWIDTHLITAIEEVITSCIIIVLYAITALSLRKLSSGKTAQQERTLLKFGVVNSAITIPAIFFQILLNYQILPAQWTSVIFYLYGPFNDVKFFTAAVTLVVVNKPFRQQLLESFGLARSKTINTTVSVSDAYSRSMPNPAHPVVTVTLSPRA